MTASGSELETRIRQALERRSDLVLAVVFGSRARGRSRIDSDFDLGVLLERDDEQSRREIDQLLTGIAGPGLDLVFLAEAPPLLRFEIARDGRVLVENRPFAWADFKARAMVDWWDWAPTARRLFEAARERLRSKVGSEAPTRGQT